MGGFVLLGESELSFCTKTCIFYSEWCQATSYKFRRISIDSTVLWSTWFELREMKYWVCWARGKVVIRLSDSSAYWYILQGCVIPENFPPKGSTKKVFCVKLAKSFRKTFGSHKNPYKKVSGKVLSRRLGQEMFVGKCLCVDPWSTNICYK